MHWSCISFVVNGKKSYSSWCPHSTKCHVCHSLFKKIQFSSVHFSRSVVSDSLWPHESQHARSPCSSPTPGVHSDSCPPRQCCHPAISSSVVPFSSCPQSLPAPKSFPKSQPFTWGGQSTGVSALASCLPKNTQGWSPGFSNDTLKIEWWYTKNMPTFQLLDPINVTSFGEKSLANANKLMISRWEHPGLSISS